MKLVGSKVVNPSDGLTLLSESTDPQQFFPTLHEIEKIAREDSILEYLNGGRQVPKLTNHISEDIFFKSVLDLQNREDRKEFKIKLKSIVASDPCYLESLRVINDQNDPNPSINGKRKTAQEANVWRAAGVVVSTSAVRQYMALRLGGPIEGPEHDASKQLVLENLPGAYISAYSNNLSIEQSVSVRMARPPDGMATEYLIDQEADNNSDIVGYELGDNLAAIKAKIRDLTQSEKSYQESVSRHNANHQSNNNVDGKIEKFVNTHVTIASNLCPEAIAAKDWNLVWKTSKGYFVEMCAHFFDESNEKAKFAPFSREKENILSFKNRLSRNLAAKQCLSQEAHSDHREIGKVDYNQSLSDVFLSDSNWRAKHPSPNGAIKASKDATVRAMVKNAFKLDSDYSNRILVELRANSDCTPAQILVALGQEEKLLGRSSNDQSVSVNAVQSTTVSGECDLHGLGHTNAQCRLLTTGKVVWDPAQNTYVFKDSGDAFKRKNPPVSNEKGPVYKKAKHDPKFHQGQGSKDKNKDKKIGKDVPKDKREKKKEKKEKKQHQKVGKVIDGLRTTIVNLIQSQSSSSSAAAAPAQAPTQAGTPPDGPIITALDKHFADLKKSIGLSDDP